MHGKDRATLIEQSQTASYHYIRDEPILPPFLSTNSLFLTYFSQSKLIEH